MKRIAATLSLSGCLVAVMAVPAEAQTLSPASAVFPDTPFRVDSAPIPFTLTGKTVNGFGINTNVGTSNTYSGGTFTETNNCPDFLKDGEACTINVVFAPYTVTPAQKSGTLFAAGLTSTLSGKGYLKGAGGKGKKCNKKKGKKGAVAASGARAAKKKKCKKK